MQKIVFGSTLSSDEILKSQLSKFRIDILIQLGIIAKDKKDF